MTFFLNLAVVEDMGKLSLTLSPVTCGYWPKVLFTKSFRHLLNEHIRLDKFATESLSRWAQIPARTVDNTLSRHSRKERGGRLLVLEVRLGDFFIHNLVTVVCLKPGSVWLLHKMWHSVISLVGEVESTERGCQNYTCTNSGLQCYVRTRLSVWDTHTHIYKCMYTYMYLHS